MPQAALPKHLKTADEGVDGKTKTRPKLPGKQQPLLLDCHDRSYSSTASDTLAAQQVQKNNKKEAAAP